MFKNINLKIASETEVQTIEFPGQLNESDWICKSDKHRQSSQLLGAIWSHIEIIERQIEEERLIQLAEQKRREEEQRQARRKYKLD